MDEDYDDDDFGPVAVPSHKARPIDFGIAVLAAIRSFVEDVHMIAMSHANWKNDRTRFMREASEEIERIVSGELTE